LELLCLRALWSLREGNVTQVKEIVSLTRPLAYTTIMTVLERLVRKGKLKRRKNGRAFVYAPETSRDEMRRAAVREVVESLFDGSEEELIRFLQDREDAGGAAPADHVPEATIDTVLL
jgi:predicted transcriptional regulator